MKNKFNFLKVSSNLITNFKPNAFFNLKNLKQNNSQIYCRNFFLYLLLIKYKNLKIFKKSTFFIKKQRKNNITILRSPYRHKLARHQIVLNRFYINSSILINVNCLISIKNFIQLKNLFFFFKKFNKIFESNIIYINNYSFKFFINYCNNFLIKFY